LETLKNRLLAAINAATDIGDTVNSTDNKAALEALNVGLLAQIGEACGQLDALYDDLLVDLKKPDKQTTRTNNIISYKANGYIQNEIIVISSKKTSLLDSDRFGPEFLKPQPVLANSKEEDVNQIALA
jgi:hypothetical protein